MTSSTYLDMLYTCILFFIRIAKLIKIIYVVMMNHALVSTLYEPELNV